MGIPLRILLIEDSEDDTLFLLHALRKGGYDPIYERVQTPTAMSAALDAQRWDIVIADYFMPKFNALQALKLLQSRELDLPFIVVSGAIGEDTAVTIMKAGAHDYLLKDNLTRLVPAVERELREAETRYGKHQAEEALRCAYEGLELLVQKRTAELKTANESLQAQIAERIRAGHHMSAQHQATQGLADSTTLGEAAPKVLQAICENLNWDLGQLWLVDVHTNLLHQLDAWSLPDKTLSGAQRAVSNMPLSPSEGMLGQIWHSKKPVWVADIQSDSQSINIQAVTQEPIRSACGFPIIHHDDVLGVMVFFCDRIRQRDAEVLKVMKAIGSQVGQFIKRRHAEEALYQLAAIVESSDDAIISTTLDGIVVSWNAGAEVMYGYSAEEAKGQLLSDLVKPNYPDPLQHNLDTQQQRDGIDHQQSMHQRKDGKLIDVFLTVSSVRDAAGRLIGTSMIARDVSDRRAIEKMKDEFVSIVSHELRTPLTSIFGSLGLLLTGKLGELPEQSKRFLEIAVSNTDRLVRLINDILDLERIGSGKATLSKQPCNIANLMTQAAEVMQAIAEKSNVGIKVSSPPIYSNVDPDRILQTLTNLLSNAIKFSPPDTTIWLNANIVDPENKPNLLSSNTKLESEKHSSTSSSQRHLPALVLTVKDQGRGIPADKLENIFERFQQVDASDSRQKGGTGLGLAICRSIVQQHGGKIWVESTLGEGSTFFVSLPLNQPEGSNHLYPPLSA